MATALQRERKTVEILRGALAQADAETVALADALRRILELDGASKTDAALYAQHIIDNAKPRGA
jgi:hypothetical protein